MGWLIDTNVAIYLRDRKAEVVARTGDLPQLPSMSIVTQVELESGVYARAELIVRRRAALDVLMSDMKILPFDLAEITAYRVIVEGTIPARRKTIDRMIAATAIAKDLTLITMNGADFRDIPGLKLEVWPSPAA